MLRTCCWLLAMLGICSLGFGQTKFTISGQIKDASNGEDLAFATILAKDLPGVGTNSNVYGFYSLTLEAGEHTIVYRSMGYSPIEKTINLTADLRIDIELETQVTSLEEVVISGEREDQNITRNEGSVTRVSMDDVKALPAFGGEPDVIKIIQLNPGIKSAGEGNSGFYVRGGGLDQNLVLLDEAPVYNPSHLLGFFSVFNGDALKSATVYKGGMMPEYGGRTASVMDIRMKDGNKKKYEVAGGIGSIASRLTVEGPIVKDRGSFMVSGRRTYADIFLALSNDEALKKSILYFYDLNLKANYRLSDRDRIYISGYFGRDKFGFDDLFGLNWGNATGTFRWNHLFTDKLFSNTSFIYSNYDYQFGFGLDDDQIALQSVIRDFNFKQDFSYSANEKNYLKFGFNVIHHTIEPGNLTAGANTGIPNQKAEEKYGLEGAAYVQNEQKIGERLSLNYGFRYSFFQQLGPGAQYEYDSEGNLVSQSNFDDWEGMQFYGGLEPRLSANFRLSSNNAIKLALNRNYQFIHLLSNATSSTPTDTWIMSSNNVKPQIADQISLGYFHNFADNMYESSVEVYYKDMQNVIDYRNGANVFFNDLLEGDLVYGDGTAYGVEFLMKKNRGKLTGWFSYTLSRTLRQFEEINNGDWFPARQDRIHDLSLVAMYQVTPKITLTGNYIYYTGDAVTFPTGKYEIEGMTIPYYTERNGYRMPDYHRMDLGITIQGKKTERFESNWNLSVYNVYGRENAYTITFQPSDDDPAVTQAVQLSLFKWVPSFTYNFKF
ncbi:TonB-dependent receptor [Pontibacter sp. G13]|uniref:TonB-dependent receptor n=1 Tax=Pontibacter sp. G13 TaxID=3074898 RepID=UPI002889C37F|nr:TonB-dependent receptor [Pontibacter sp. G13]WNJ18458.1 TonB-dependent receptor [Pontibacter sp. G13]